jgi:hypothetical protein
MNVSRDIQVLKTSSSILDSLSIVDLECADVEKDTTESTSSTRSMHMYRNVAHC